MTRKGFLGSIVALGATGWAIRTEAAQGVFKPAGKLRLKAGVFSDLHISDEKSVAIVEKALRHFRRERVDVVVCTGDVANTGLKSQLDLFEAVWDRVFPGGKGESGVPVERVFVTGNHDKGVMGQHTDASQVKNHKTFLGEPLVPAFVRTVKGYSFVCQNWIHGKEARELIRAHASELKGSKPFFYLQHSHLKGTIPNAWITDRGETTSVLKDFPNCVALTGHSHWPLVDERSLWQGAFTAVNCACLRYCMQPGGRENTRTFGVVDPKTSQMPPLDTMNDCQSAMVMCVYDDAIVFSRWDEKNALPLAADWVVPWPPNGEAAIEARAKRTPVPRFAAGAEVTVRRGKGTNRAGKSVEQVFVDFPNCRESDGSPVRAFDFEVSLETRLVDVVRPTSVKRVFSRGFYRAESKDEPTVTCAFGLEELPVAPKINDGPKRSTAAYRFVVRPCNSFGAKGPEICTAWTELTGEEA